MSVQSQIDRIDGNVKKALAKIAEKGVTVASDANSDDLEALIAAIEAGGGSGGGGANYGTIIYESYSQTLSLGVPIPEDNFFIAILPTKTKGGSLGNLYLFHGMYRKIEGNVSAIVQSTSNSDANTGEWAIDRSANTITLSNRFFCADYEYAWFMGELA